MTGTVAGDGVGSGEVDGMKPPYVIVERNLLDSALVIEGLRLEGQGLHIRLVGATRGRFIFTDWAEVLIRDIWIDNAPRSGVLLERHA